MDRPESDMFLTSSRDMFYHNFDTYACHNLVVLYDSYIKRSQKEAEIRHFYPCPSCVLFPGISRSENLRRGE